MKATYTRLVLEGDAKTVGRERAKWMKRNHAPMIPFFTSPFEGKIERLKEAERLLALNDRWCPGLNEEIEGFASELAVAPEAVVYYTVTMPRSSSCSQFAMLGDRTKSGHVICGRSYEWSTDDELSISTVRIKGRRAHTGFSLLQFGRTDGLNDAGLWVSMSAANPNSPLPDNVGFRFWSLVRTILDRAGTVEEAIAIAEPFPLAFHMNLLVADKAGHAALIEKGPDGIAVTRAREGFLFSTNHYLHEPMAGTAELRYDHSQKRYDFLERNAPAPASASVETAKKLLSASFPDGLACHFYTEWLGTIWSMYADLSDGSLEVCFGATDDPANRYRRFGNDDPAGIATYEAELPDTMAPEGTWKSWPNPAKKP